MFTTKYAMLFKRFSHFLKKCIYVQQSKKVADCEYLSLFAFSYLTFNLICSIGLLALTRGLSRTDKSAKHHSKAAARVTNTHTFADRLTQTTVYAAEKKFAGTAVFVTKYTPAEPAVVTTSTAIAGAYDSVQRGYRFIFTYTCQIMCGKWTKNGVLATTFSFTID